MSNTAPDSHRVTWTSDKTARLWDYYSSSQHIEGLYFSKQVGHIVFNYAKRHINMAKVHSILDYGCGQGHMLKHLLSLASDHQSCYGLDFSEKSVARVNSEFSSSARFKGAACLGDESELIPDSSMDLIFVLEVIEHLDDQQLNIMKNTVYRKLKHGGSVVVTTPNQENLNESVVFCPDCGATFHRWQHIRRWDPKSITVTMQHSGFKTIHANETNFKIPNFLLARILLLFWPEYKRNLIYIGRK